MYGTNVQDCLGLSQEVPVYYAVLSLEDRVSKRTTSCSVTIMLLYNVVSRIV